MHVRQEYVESFRRTASSLLQQCQPNTTAFHWYTRQVVEHIAAGLQLVAVRPLQRHPNCTPPRVKGSSLLKLSVEVLQKLQALINDSRGVQWRWFESVFVPWHALAVALAELCVCEDQVLVERYWPPIELAYDRYSTLVADLQTGMLWKPVENLMKRAQAKISSTSILISPGETTDHSAGEQQPLPFTPGACQTVQLETRIVDANPTFPSGLDTWPSVWETMDVGDELDDVCNTAWANWESFVHDLHVRDDFMFRSG